jgi:MFS family permease|tara:strand:- start:75 stop:1274 length:1200 start_codon:yes stop_codon:yes gene_type:complete
MKLFEKHELKLLWPFYLETFVANLFLIFPIFWIIQFQETLPLSQIGLIFSAIAISTFLFEVPTGAIADIFGRKFSVISGLILSGVTLILITFTKDFYFLLVLFFLWGIFGTLISGADIAWVADNLKYKRKSKILQSFFVKKASFLRLSLVLAGFIGGVLVKYFGLNIIWPISGFSLILSGIILSFIGEHKLTKEKEDKTLLGIFRQTLKSIKFSLKHHLILSFAIISILAGLLLSFAGDLIWKPYLLDFNIPLSYFGYLFSVATGLGIIAPFIGMSLAKKLKKDKFFFAFILIFEILFLSLAIFVFNWITLAIIMLLFVFFFDMFEPIQRNYFQKFLPSEKRATLSSLLMMCFSLGIIIGGPLAGLTADNFGFKVTLLIGILFIIPMILLFLKDKKTKK